MKSKMWLRRLVPKLCIFVLLILAVSLLLAVSPSSTAQATWSGYVYDNVLSFGASSISENLLNFPILVTVDSTHFDLAKFTAGGTGGVAFLDSDGITRLPCEVEDWTDGAGGHFWVGVPQIDASSNYTDFIYIYYGNPVVTASSFNPTSVWNSNYVAVYHMYDSPDNSHVADSTSNGNNGTKTGAGNPSQVNAKIYKGQSFPGVDSVINSGNTTSLNAITGNVTIEAWLNPVSLGENNTGTIFSKANISFFQTATAAAYFGVTTAGGFKSALAANNSVPLGSSTYLAGIYNGSNVLIVTNTTLVTGNAQTGAISDHSTAACLIGDRVASDRCLNAVEDEVRISNVAHSANWLKATYLSETDTLLYYGATDPAPSITTLDAVSIAMDKDGVTSGSFSGNVTSLGGTPSISGWFDYGTTLSYGSSTSNVTYNSTGVKTIAIPASLLLGQTYHYRFNANNADGTTLGNDKTFTLTLPSITTNAVSGAYMDGGTHATLNGNVDNMGVASNTYVSFQWGYSSSYGTTIGTQVVSGTGAVSTTLTGYDPTKTIYFRVVTSNGTSYVHGNGQSFNLSAMPQPGGSMIVPAFTVASIIYPLALIIFSLVFIIKLGTRDSEHSKIVVLLLIVMIIIGALSLLSALSSSFTRLFGG